MRDVLVLSKKRSIPFCLWFMGNRFKYPTGQYKRGFKVKRSRLNTFNSVLDKVYGGCNIVVTPTWVSENKEHLKGILKNSVKLGVRSFSVFRVFLLALIFQVFGYYGLEWLFNLVTSRERFFIFSLVTFLTGLFAYSAWGRVSSSYSKSDFFFVFGFYIRQFLTLLYIFYAQITGDSVSVLILVFGFLVSQSLRWCVKNGG